MHSLMTLAIIPFAFAGANATPPWRVYVGTYAQGDEKGIYLLHFNSETGQIKLEGRACEAEGPSFLALHPSKPVLYVVGETVYPEGIVGAYRIDGRTGLLTLINQQSSKGRAPCHLAVAPAGKHVVVANYSSGTVSMYPVEENGGLGAACAVVQHTGTGANPRRQEGPHAHSVNFDAAGRFVFAADLGVDKVYVYRYDAAEGTLAPAASPFATLAAGAGPRHLAFHPSGRNAYVANELDSTVSAFAFNAESGQLDMIASVPTLPPDFEGESTTAEIRVHPSGRFLYASNRGHDSIAVFSLDPETGRLTPLGHAPSGGETPRNFNIDPTGRFLIAANQASNNVVVFRIDSENGSLELTGEEVAVPEPVCVVFSRIPGA